MFAEGKYPAAETALLEAAKLDPKDARTFLDLGELYLQGLGRPVDAERAFRRAVECAPQHAGARHGLGMSLAASRRFTEAVVELKESARLSPGNPVPLVSLGKVYLVQGKPDAALEAFESASRIAPDLVAAFEGAGDACMQKKDYVRAEARYAQVVDRAPGDAGAQFKHGNALLMLERWSDAEAAFLLAVKADKAHAAAYNNLAWILLQREERSDQALEWARQAVELQPAQPAFQDTLGMVHLMRAEPDAAVAALRRASASTPPVASYIYHLGLALEARGAGKEAVLEYRRALQIDPRFADAADAKRRIAQPGP
jgi:Flp pilus assembly protein TadD